MGKLKLQLCGELCGTIEVLAKSYEESALTIVKANLFHQQLKYT